MSFRSGSRVWRWPLAGNRKAHDRKGEALQTVGWALLTLILQSLAFHPFDLWPLAWVAWVPWMLWYGPGHRRGLKRGLLLGWYVHFGSVLLWITETSFEALFFVPLMGLPFVLLQAFGMRWLLHHCRATWVLGFALPIVLTEWMRDQVLGLSWSSIGYSQWRWLEGLQSAAVLRVYGLSLLVLFVNAALAQVIHWYRTGRPDSRARSARLTLATVVALIGLVHVLGAWRIDATSLSDGPRAMGIQVHITPERRRTLSFPQQWSEHFMVAATDEEAWRSADLVVVPETMLRWVKEPDFPLEHVLQLTMAPVSRARYGDLIRGRPGQVGILGCLVTRPTRTGTSDRDENGDGNSEFNQAVVVTYGKSEGRQDEAPRILGAHSKRICVPIGEVVPGAPGFPLRKQLKDYLRNRMLQLPDITPGEEWTVVSAKLGETNHQVGLNICYEMVFPESFREPVRKGADFVVNVSNDTWYGTSSELDLVHVAARFRAVECGRSLFRVSNGGISTSVDPLGRYRAVVMDRGETKGVSGVLSDQIPLADTTTPWVRFGEAGLGGFLALIFLATGFGSRIRHRNRPG